jgi:hypothetical protein
MYDYVVDWYQKHPTAFSDAYSRFKRVMAQTRGTKYSLMAEEKMRQVQADRAAAIDKVMATIKQDTEYLVRDKALIDAAREYEIYDGPLAAETKRERLRIAKAFRKQVADEEQARIDKRKAAERAFRKALQTIADNLLSSGPAATLATAENYARKETDPKRRKALAGCVKLIKEAAGMDKRIMMSFKKDRGRTITVSLVAGPLTLKIESITAERVSGSQRIRAGSGFARRPAGFTLEDLSPREKLNRMGDDSEPAVALTKGLMAVNSSATDYAADAFANVPAPIGPILLKRLGRGKAADPDTTGAQDSDAEDALRLVLRVAGITVGTYDGGAWLSAVQRHRVPADSAARLRTLVRSYRDRYGKTAFARKARKILLALENIRTR